MKTYKGTYDFYRGEDWAAAKTQVLHERIREDGKIYCEHCGQPITGKGIADILEDIANKKGLKVEAVTDDSILMLTNTGKRIIH